METVSGERPFAGKEASNEGNLLGENDITDDALVEVKSGEFAIPPDVLARGEAADDTRFDVVPPLAEDAAQREADKPTAPPGESACEPLDVEAERLDFVGDDSKLAGPYLETASILRCLLAYSSAIFRKMSRQCTSSSLSVL